MLEAGLICSRFLHYAVLMVLFGVSLFPLYAYPSGPQPAWLVRWLRPADLIAAAGALISAVLWLLFVVGHMSGTINGAIDRDTVWSVLHDTDFGRVWSGRLALAIVVLGLTGVRVLSTATGHRDRLTPLFSAALLASLAAVGHTQLNEGIAGIIHMGADGAHLLAAGAWLGGLLPLGLIIVRAGSEQVDQTPDAGHVLLRFSGLGYIAVATLVASGLLNSWFLVGSFSGLTHTPYGQLLLLKLCLFAGLVALAALNRFWLVPSLTRAREIGAPAVWLAKLRKHIVGEQVLGLLIILIVSILGSMRPAINQS
jgi:putative copper resistance protein D